MAEQAIPITVASTAALSHVHVAEQQDGTLAYVAASAEYFELRKASGAPPNGTTIIEPIAGSPIAGAAGARWHLAIGAVSTASSLYVELDTDEQIEAVAPTAPFTFPAGQPEVLLTLPFDFGAGPVIITTSFNGALASGEAGETDPLLWLQIWVDGVQQTDADSIVSWDSQGGTTPLDQITAEATQMYRYVATDGPHTVELRWGVVGAVPNVTALCFGAGGGNHASMTVARQS